MSAETPAPPSCDVAHLSCLERAAADPDATQAARQRIRARIAEHRVVLALVGADLPRGAE